MQQLSIEDFAPHVGRTFTVEGEAATLTLAEASELPASSRQGTPFRLLFRGPAQPILPQGTYRFRRGDGNSFDIFVVPLRPDANGAHYEAIFN